MDGKRFDLITRALGDASSRRSLLGLLAGLIAAPLAAGQAGATSGRTAPVPEGPCGDRTRKDNACTKGSQCCTGYCSMKTAKKNKDGTGRCRCLKKGKRCTENRNCCRKRCVKGVCGGKSRATPPACENCAAGCCDGTTCLAYASQSTSQCGTSGRACAVCASGEDCISGSCLLPPSCDASNCASGCCDGTTCVDYANQTTSECGTGGAACAACTGSDTCSASGVCTPPPPSCDATSCSGGCCDGTTCVPYAAQSNGQCGTNGAACVACGQFCNTSGSCYGGGLG
jgi:hypothetical protein